MDSKLFVTICVLLVLIQYCVAASPKLHDIKLLHSRQKRGSPDFFGKIKHHLTASVGKASSSSAGAASGTSASKTFTHHEKPPPVKEHFDAWELKKSILNTLFQAVKAITGGVTAIKGQLIKGSGYALSHGGKLIAASGDAVTSVGKKIALSAKLLPPEKAHKFFGSSGHGYGHDDISSYGHDELVEFAHPHDFTGFVPESPIPQYLPVDVGYDNHFADVHEPHAHYGPPPPLSHYSHLTNYIGTERKEQENHYEQKNDAPRVPGLETDHEQATHDVNQKAVEALQHLLRKLPHKDNTHLTQSIDDDNLIPDTKLQIPPSQLQQQPQPITQYQIPNDPHVSIPKFKPIKSSVTSTYTQTFQLGPIDSYGSQSHPQAVVDDVRTKANHIHMHKGPVPHSGHGTQLPINIVPPLPPAKRHHQQYQHQKSQITSTTFKSQPSPNHSSHTHTINTQPLDLYHTMTLKQQPNHANQIVQYSQLPSTTQKHQQPQQHIPQLPSRAHQFEIQKSIEYQLH